ncbi:GEMI7 protein, partial [Rhipidura dahli]|nr:GEMI7 protein [Rhipidura dahli]
QRVRALLRERFLRLLSLARGRPARFSLWSGGAALEAELEAELGAADAELGALQVDSLRTPLGTQRAALLRAGDVLGF